MDLLDALVDGRGRVAAAEALGVNYRTVAKRQQSRLVSQRMRQVLQEFRDSQDASDGGPGIVAMDGAGEDVAETPEDRAAALEQENRELRETVNARAEALRRHVAELKERSQAPGGASAVGGGQGKRGNGGHSGGVPGCQAPAWSRWMSSPTRLTPSVRRRRWWPSGGMSGTG